MVLFDGISFRLFFYYYFISYFYYLHWILKKTDLMDIESEKEQ